MLPTTGHFKNISCPFYDSCICERPYCHFKHSKRDTLNDTNLISELVSKAVHKVLNSNNHNNVNASSPVTTTATATVAPAVAEETNEKSSSNASSDSSNGNVTYNPTPISELNKFKSKEIPERRNRHIPIQYTPEQPRSFRSTNSNINTSLSVNNPLEYSIEISDSINDPPGYSPSVNTISYIPSSIVTCQTQTTPTTTILDTATTTNTVTTTETNSHQYVPFNLNFQDSQSSALTVEYNPTKNLSLDSPPSYSEYVPKYNDEFIDEFINDPNIYEPTEILTSVHNKNSPKTTTKQKNSPQLAEEDKKPVNKNKHPVDDVKNHSRSSSSRHSRHTTNKSKHKDKRKDREKESETRKDREKESEIRKDREKESEIRKDREKESEIRKDREKESEIRKDREKESEIRKDRGKESEIKNGHGDIPVLIHDKHKTSKSGDVRVTVPTSVSEHNKLKTFKSGDAHVSVPMSVSEDEKRKSRNRSHSKHKHSHSKSSSVQTSTRDKREINTNSNHAKVKMRDKSKIKHKMKSSDDDQRPISPVSESDDFSYENQDDSVVDLSDESDDELEQCKRIFEEYQPPAQNVQIQVKKKSKPEETENEVVALKRRVAHEKSSRISRKHNVKHVVIKKAALVMANRYQQVLSNLDMKNHNQNQISSSPEPSEVQAPVDDPRVSVRKRLLNNTVQKATDDTPSDFMSPNPAKIKRIAHVPNVSSLLSAKKKVEEISKIKSVPMTPMQTVAKGNKRVAHMPEVSIAEIPTVLQSEKSKLPVNVRSRFLFLMIKECVKLYVSKKAAYDRALNEELNCYSKCSAIATYRNSVMLTINRLRKESESGSNSSPTTNSDNLSDFSGKKFYDNISKWILSEEELMDNGYPRPGASRKGYAIFKENKVIEKIPENSQLCVRCKKIYKIDEFGFQMYPEDCIYHPGSRFVYRGETKYICCKESTATSGCCICSNHVFEIRDPRDLSGFVTTLEPESDSDPRNYAVFALDCEMVYTTRGFVLARITVIDHSSNVVFESMVKPAGHILDCNTRFSGLTTDMLDPVTTKLVDVQAKLLVLFNSKTILMGHSLESDLKALRIMHSTVIDTSVLFPHKMGPPKKRALRNLASDYLKKIIQNNESGHDSAEDAITCMELVLWKLKEEIKLR